MVGIKLTETEQIAWNAIKQASRIVITSHVHPDGDAVGSCLALANYFMENRKQVSIHINDYIPHTYRYLKGYQPLFVSKGLDIMEGNEESALLVILDTNPARIGQITGISFSKTVNIDHHVTNPKACDYHIIRVNSSSTAEILYRLFKNDGYAISEDTANCLYTGLITDTEYFKAANVTAESYHIAGELVKCGAKPVMITDFLERKEYDEVILIARVLSSTRLFLGGKVAGVCLDTYYDNLELTDTIIDTIRYINGISIAFLLKHERDGGYRVRLRSNSIDVGMIAKQNGGGGHKEAAGFTIDKDDPAAAERIIVEELRRWLV